MSCIEEAIGILSKKEDLTAFQMEGVMKEIMSGTVETAQIVAFLLRLSAQGETPEEVAAAARVMREHAVKIKTRHRVILDTCGTGGDGKHTFNISTAVAFVAAGAGVAVAKHGNRAVSSKVGSADVLEALGVNINMPKEKAEGCLNETGITFLFAPNFHPAMKYVMPARKQIAAKTIFNFLGPLSNPAGARYQLIGVYDSAWAYNLAAALKGLDAIHALVIHGRDGMDEITTSGKTLVYEVYRSEVLRQEEIDFSEFGFKQSHPDVLKGGDTAQENAAIITGILKGKEGFFRNVVVLNAAAALYAATDELSPLKEGIKEKINLAEDSIDSGKALEKLELLKEYSRK